MVVAATHELRTFSAVRFVREMKAKSEQSDARIAFFLGAGCSVSSGIPAAGKLVRDRWLPQLRHKHGKDSETIEHFVAGAYPGWQYDPHNPAANYGEVMKELFPFPDDRQKEIESLCDNRSPGFGYAMLAALIARNGGCFNVVLTTNFDDMVADSLYLYSDARPLVIHHESLANYIKPTRTRPLVVKLHGDHRLSPSNTAEEVQALKTEIVKQVNRLICDRTLIFLGYGGYDEGICKMLEGLPPEACDMGVYWVNAMEPIGPIREWLNTRQAIWVQQGDFDELMLLFQGEFKLPHPQKQRFDDLFTRYMETYEKLSIKIKTRDGENEETHALKSAVQKADDSFTHWWAVEVKARDVKISDPDAADRIYQEGIQRFPNSAPLLGNYALFLKNVRKDYEAAEEYYRKALDADPTNATTLGNYAIFLEAVRKDYAAAEEYYRKALGADPTHANSLGNYASFLKNVRKDYEAAEEYYRKALDAGPTNATTLGSYAIFLNNVRKDYATAEEYYRKALEADPNDAITLGNYAGLLLALERHAEGMQRLEELLASDDATLSGTLQVELWFYAYAHRQDAGARTAALGRLVGLVREGKRSPGWPLDQHIARAQASGHPHVPLLQALDAVITRDAPLSTLDAFLPDAE